MIGLPRPAPSQLLGTLRGHFAVRLPVAVEIPLGLRLVRPASLLACLGGVVTPTQKTQAFPRHRPRSAAVLDILHESLALLVEVLHLGGELPIHSLWRALVEVAFILCPLHVFLFLFLVLIVPLFFSVRFFGRICTACAARGTFGA